MEMDHVIIDNLTPNKQDNLGRVLLSQSFIVVVLSLSGLTEISNGQPSGSRVYYHIVLSDRNGVESVLVATGRYTCNIMAALETSCQMKHVSALWIL
jgi:hypothetical protein